jgi:hypothetical protein
MATDANTSVDGIDGMLYMLVLGYFAHVEKKLFVVGGSAFERCLIFFFQP